MGVWGFSVSLGSRRGRLGSRFLALGIGGRGLASHGGAAHSASWARRTLDSIKEQNQEEFTHIKEQNQFSTPRKISQGENFVAEQKNFANEKSRFLLSTKFHTASRGGTLDHIQYSVAGVRRYLRSPLSPAAFESDPRKVGLN